MNIKANISHLILLAVFLLAGSCYAFAQSVPIPNPAWPLDSVVNGSVHYFEVPGDRNFDDPSRFVWTVDGGRLFIDEDLTVMAGDGSTATVNGNAQNTTGMWVIWDSFDQPLDTGYIYVYEISADGCQRADDDPGKYQGMRVKVSAPPDVYFLTQSTVTCSNEEGVLVDLVIDGMPPFDLKYALNEVEYDMHILPEDLVDSDYDGEVNNITFLIDDYTGTTVDKEYTLTLMEASSGGVKGNIMLYPEHTVYAYVQPPAPVISPDWLQVTTGQLHRYDLADSGVDAATWFWELLDPLGNVVFEASSDVEPGLDLRFDYGIGDFTLVAYYQAQNGCISLTDSMVIEVYDLPTIAFADESPDITSCSEVSINPGEVFEFIVEYEGALTYDFAYEVYDYNGNLLFQTLNEYQSGRRVLIQIPHTFINPELTNEAWKVRIVNAVNEEGVDVEILDAAIEGGRDERLIIIHPKPVVNDDINFAN